VKSLTDLWKVLAQDLGERCAVDTTHDHKTVVSRAEHEGMEFLTITLPTLQKAFERWLELGYVDPSLCTSFRYRESLPVFLQGFFGLVFNSDGFIRETASPDAVLAIRQLTGVYGKMFILASPERIQKAMMQYLDTDSELERVETRLASETDSLLALRRIFTLLFHRVLDNGDSDIATGQMIPKHGPGSTADGLRGNAKFRMDWSWRLEEFFKSDEFILPSPRHHAILDDVRFRDPEEELPVKVVPVPKTQKTPRLIAMEPTAVQFAQQAVAGILTERINEDRILKRLVRFSDQEPNQVLAREGSLTGALATLDLSEASDRVSNYLVRSLFGPWTHLNGAIQACRSRRAEVRIDDNSLITREIVKFASMGSALTFPIEAMVFLTIIFRGIEKSVGRSLQEKDIKFFLGRVAVYGDDIIIPVHYVRSVIHELESFGFKVNSSKSFWTGRFRESCGKDYFDGTDVSYIKFRKEYPDDRRDAIEVISLVSFFNQAKENHFVRTTQHLRKELKRLLGKNFFPRVTRDSEILGEWDDIRQDIVKLHKDTQAPLTKGYVIRVEIPENPLDGELALLKYFLHKARDGEMDEYYGLLKGINPLGREHLLRSGRSSGVSINLREAAV
jgi:hypothetical protein